MSLSLLVAMLRPSQGGVAGGPGAVTGAGARGIGGLVSGVWR